MRINNDSEARSSRTNSGAENNDSRSTSNEDCGVHTNTELSLVHTKSTQARHDNLADLTATEYRTLQDAFDWFNEMLFEGGLPQVLITLQRHHCALGYFSPNRFQSRGNTLKNVHEVALNPDGFFGNSDKAILSILVHEMVHVWQEEHGTKHSRVGYHNREWAGKMCTIGLMPSSTGRPGGAVTGESVSHYIMVGAEFDAECDQFLDKCRLAWESAPVRPDDDEEDPREDDQLDEDDVRIGLDLSRTRSSARQTRVKFSCPNCDLNAWAKPGAELACIPCSVEANELIRMLPNESSPVRKAKLPIQSVGGATVNALAIH